MQNAPIVPILILSVLGFALAVMLMLSANEHRSFGQERGARLRYDLSLVVIGTAGLLWASAFAPAFAPKVVELLAEGLAEGLFALKRPEVLFAGIIGGSMLISLGTFVVAFSVRRHDKSDRSRHA